MKRCKECSELFQPDQTNRQQYCGDKCKKNAFAKKARERRAFLKTLENKRCPVCSKKVKPPQRKYCSYECGQDNVKAVKTTFKCRECGKISDGIAGKKYCSKECGNKHRNRYRNLPIIKNCKECNNPFESRHGAKLCSRACRVKSSNRNASVSDKKYGYYILDGRLFRGDAKPGSKKWVVGDPLPKFITVVLPYQ